MMVHMKVKKATWWRLLCACWQGTIVKIDVRRQRNCKKHIWVWMPYSIMHECESCGAYLELEEI